MARASKVHFSVLYLFTYQSTNGWPLLDTRKIWTLVVGHTVNNFCKIIYMFLCVDINISMLKVRIINIRYMVKRKGEYIYCVIMLSIGNNE